MTRRALVWVHDIAGDQAGVIGRGFTDLYVDITLDQSETLVFEIPADHPKAYLLAPDVTLRLGGRRFYVDSFEQTRRGTEATIRIEANALWYRLGESDWVGSRVLSAAGIAAGGQAILIGSGWTCDATRSNGPGGFSMEQQDKTYLAMCRTWAKITGTYLEFDTANLTVSWLETRGRELGVAFRTGRNLIGTERRRRAPSVTQIYPFGADDLGIAGVNAGVPYVEDLSYYTAQGLSEATARAMYTKRRTYVDSAFIVDTDLLAAATAKLAIDSQAVEEVELDVIDISELTGVPEDLEPGDRVTAQDGLNVEYRATVSRFQRHPLQPWRNQIELSTSPRLVSDPTESNGRDQRSSEWNQFDARIAADYAIRNDGDYIVARIPLRFRDGGMAHFGADLTATGVGAGTMIVSIVDTAANPEIELRSTRVAYTDGVAVHVSISGALPEISGSRYFALRVTTEATSGPTTSLGVNITADPEVDTVDLDVASFWFMASGAVQETPAIVTSEVFSYTGAVQYFEVPDNITEVTIEALGAVGTGPTPGGGAQVSAVFAVTPGSTLDVYVGGYGSQFVGGWPNGGTTVQGELYRYGGQGGGSSDVRSSGAAFSDAWIVAGGGGGGGEHDGGGGDGGFLSGANGSGGNGATQTAGGSGGPFNFTDGSFNQGGAGYGGDTFSDAGGAGGGGWYGGEGGGTSGIGFFGKGGGGGSGHVNSAADELFFADGVNVGHGQITISWEVETQE